MREQYGKSSRHADLQLPFGMSHSESKTLRHSEADKQTNSESKRSKMTPHETQTFPIHSSLPKPQHLAGILGQWCNYGILIVFYEVWEILSYLWIWNTIVFFLSLVELEEKKAKYLQMEPLS